MSTKPKFLWANYESRSPENTSTFHRTIATHNLPSKAAATILMAQTPVVESAAKGRLADSTEQRQQKDAFRRHDSGVSSDVDDVAKPRVAPQPPFPEQVKYRTRPLTTAPITKRERIRPSLSDQLASITSNSTMLIDNMKQCIMPTEGDCKETPVLLIYSKKTVVGKSESLYSSPVQFFRTRCHYTFHHPTEKRVEMEMNYKDMAGATLNETQKTFTFRVNRQLGRAPHLNQTRISLSPTHHPFSQARVR